MLKLWAFWDIYIKSLMKIFLEYDVLSQSEAGKGSEGVVYNIGGKHVVKVYEIWRRPHVEKKVIESFKKLRQLNHPNINTPLSYKIEIIPDIRNEKKKYLQVLYEKLFKITDENFEYIIKILEYGMKDGFKKHELEMIEDIISEEGLGKYRKNILGLIDAYNEIKKFYKNTLDVHEGNIMQDKKGTWKIIDF